MKPNVTWTAGGIAMNDTGKEDLRVIRTKEAIRKTFEEMICEMDYEQISIKELTERASRYPTS